MSGFPALQHALTLQTFKGGSLKSEPGFSPTIDAEFVFGVDFFRADPSQKHVRLDVKSLLKNENGSFINFSYTGVLEATKAVLNIFEGSPDAASTDFGDSFCHFTFETGDDNLKALETSVFVGAGRFIFEHGKPLVVEYKISKVVKG